MLCLFCGLCEQQEASMGLGMRLVILYYAQAMIVLELMPFGDLAAYLKKNHT